jgi:uncharacterized alkaline shock family protein YloU
VDQTEESSSRAAGATQHAEAHLTAYGEHDESQADQLRAIGAVRIAPRVLRTVVEEAAMRVPGTVRTADMRARWPQLLGRPLPHHGVGIVVHDGSLSVDLYLVVDPMANLIEVGAAVQEAVASAVEHILGMRASAINVYIQDVA